MQSALDKEHIVTFTLHSRALLIEMLGTFLLCYFSLMVPNNIGAGSSISYSVYSVGLIALSLAYGYAHLIGKHISGGHYNPAVTMAMVFTGKMPLLAGSIYIFFQFLGGALGGFLTGYIYNIDLKSKLLTGQEFFYVRTSVLDIHFYQALIVEIVGTLMLILVYLRTLETKQEDTAVCAVAIGLTQLFVSTGAWLFSGWGNNPARMFGITFFANTVTNTDFWVYYLGPFVAAILAWYFERYLLADSHGEFSSDLKKVSGWFTGGKKDTAPQESAPALPIVTHEEPKRAEASPIPIRLGEDPETQPAN